ncbi:MAG: hypothetical protein Tsb007_02070 [Rhizobacter sp.]
MTPILVPPPERTRASAAPCPAHPPVDRRHGTAQDLLVLLPFNLLVGIPLYHRLAQHTVQ